MSTEQETVNPFAPKKDKPKMGRPKKEVQATIEEVQQTAETPKSTDVSALMDYVKKLEKRVEKAEAKANEAISGEKTSKDMDLDDDDFISEGVTFFCPKSGFPIVDDFRRGIRSVIPHGKELIMFTHLMEKKEMVDKHEETRQISSYTAYRKKEIEWLRNHSLYGTIIREDLKYFLENDITLIRKTATVLPKINSMGIEELVNQCERYGIPVSDSKQHMKIQLSEALVKEQQDGERKRVRDEFDRIQNEALLRKENAA